MSDPQATPTTGVRSTGAETAPQLVHPPQSGPWGGRDSPTWSYSEQGAKRFLVVLVGIELLLTAVYVFTQLVVPSWGFLGGVFNLGDDLSIPSWFSSTQLAALGATFLLAIHSRHSLSRVPVRLLALFALGAFYLSVDEGAGIHERVTRATSEADLTWLQFRGNHGGWIAIYAVLALVVILFAARLLRLLWSQHRHEASIAVIGMGMYLAGGVAIEIVGYEIAAGEQTAVDTVLVGAEELLEMAGVSVVLYAALLLALRVAAPPAADRRAP